ncbi:hypothetical protein JVU11DRAFT_8662 [Chiua virens]|nr:hypothetical protein JVU11DRAFT_8662 [Chiua virens]
MKKTYFDFVVDQWSTVPPVENADLTGKTIVVVGANTGIGFEAAKHFARMNPAKLILACRSETKGQAAVSVLQEKFQQECDRLDILVMNAGIVSFEYKETVNGWESSLQVNHLGTALLSLLLLPRLVETGRKVGSTSRLVIVASEVHYWADIPKDVVESSNPLATLTSSKYRDPLSMRRRYNETKLLNVLFARALQDRLQSIVPLTVNSVNPGLCSSGLLRELKGILLNVIMSIMNMCLGFSAEQGSRQLVYGAIGERDNEDHMKGAYISKAAVAEPSDFVISEEGKKMQDNVWRETIEILTKEDPQLTSIVREYLV